MLTSKTRTPAKYYGYYFWLNVLSDDHRWKTCLHRIDVDFNSVRALCGRHSDRESESYGLKQDTELNLSLPICSYHFWQQLDFTIRVQGILEVIKM